jgi:hypothetical protein
MKPRRLKPQDLLAQPGRPIRVLDGDDRLAAVITIDNAQQLTFRCEPGYELAGATLNVTLRPARPKPKL